MCTGFELKIYVVVKTFCVYILCYFVLQDNCLTESWIFFLFFFCRKSRSKDLKRKPHDLKFCHYLEFYMLIFLCP
jgi:hypothetical protein